jgi:hypothetical protein
MVHAPDIALSGVTVVVRGLFNPAIVSPLWLRDQDLIGPEEHKEASIDIVSRELTSFQTGWLRCQVSQEFLSVATLDMDETERMRDVLSGILKLLNHTPIAALGINVDTHFVAESEEAWDRIGHVLAPKEPWHFLRTPGMKSVSIIGLRPDLYVGHVLVTVQPSTRVRNGVYVQQNDHFDLDRVSELSMVGNSQAEQQADATPKKIPMAIQVLDEEWKASLRRADEAVKGIAKLGETQ